MSVDPSLLRLLVLVHEHGGFAAAAKHMNVDRSSVSHAVARLERQLGARLFHRTTRRFAVTDEGLELLEMARNIDEALRRVECWREERQIVPQGRLRVTCPAAVGRTLVLPMLPAFRECFPGITVQCQFEDRLADLVAERFDIALRVTAHPPEGLIALPLSRSDRVLLAAPRYLELHGTPEHPSDLAAHRCLVYGNGDAQYNEWPFEDGSGTLTVKVPPYLLVNDGRCLVELAAGGHGLVLVDRPLALPEIRQRALVPITLTPFRPVQGPGLHAVYPKRQWMPLRTRLFIDALKRILEERATSN